MRKIYYTPYFLFTGFLLTLMSMSQEKVDGLRSLTVGMIAPLWDTVHSFKGWLSSVVRMKNPYSLEVEQLKLENQMLRLQVEKMAEWLLFEERIDEQWERLKTLRFQKEEDFFWKEFLQRRCELLATCLDLQSRSLPARVIFRETASFSNALWVNVGERDNEALGYPIVVQNSPVVLGTSLVGVVEYVGRSQSRIRLITDAALVPAVRVLRGGEQNRVLLEHVIALLKIIEVREDVFSEDLLHVLMRLKQQLAIERSDQFLAKGEIYGSNGRGLRSHSLKLKGVGFNYDFADEEGPARDLRTGDILKEGDLLVTSGLDGIFPAGLRVAIVSKVQQLREGATSYELEALPCVLNLHNLTHVLILPPVE